MLLLKWPCGVFLYSLLLYVILLLLPCWALWRAEASSLSPGGFALMVILWFGRSLIHPEPSQSASGSRPRVPQVGHPGPWLDRSLPHQVSKPSESLPLYVMVDKCYSHQLSDPFILDLVPSAYVCCPSQAFHFTRGDLAG